MVIKSIFQDMKEEIGSISRRGFEVRLGNGFRSRSHRVVQDSSAVPVDALMQSCWANMPPELLRDVLMRIEDSENIWPPRKHVAACAGVCRSWREIMKEIVKTPEISSSAFFPAESCYHIFMQPNPRNSLSQCYIKRSSSGQTYYLYLGKDSVSYDDGKFLLAARKCRHPTCTDYIITMNPGCFSKGSSAYIGKLRSNFLGTKFTIYDSQPSGAGPRILTSHSTRLASFKQAPRVPSGNYPIARLSYELNVLGSRGPRRMQCMMDTISASSIEVGGEASTPTEFLPSSVESFPSIVSGSKSTHLDNITPGTVPNCSDGNLVLRNKTPRWHEQLQCWCLNFNGRVTVASVKNFQLVASAEDGSEHENVILQFGKVGKDVFTMVTLFRHFRPSLSPLAALTPKLHVNEAQSGDCGCNMVSLTALGVRAEQI